jgi:hypothetical protein
MNTNDTLSKYEPHHDIYCRGCHARPSYKNRATYLCAECWDRYNLLWRSAEELDDSEVDAFRSDLTAFIKSRNRYVWHPEIYMYLKPISIGELKRHNLKVAVTCRELGLYAPADDRTTRETVERIKAFVMDFIAIHQRVPKVTEVLKGAKVDHTTLWSCMDYDAYIKGLGGRLKMEMRHRFHGKDDFLDAAADIVREHGCPLHMTVILDELGVSYPAYLDHFESVTPDEIHDKAGIPRVLDGVDSLLEEAARRALNQLGWEVEPGFSFDDLTGKEGRPMKYDFKLSGVKTLVEIDDVQHLGADFFMSKPNILLNDQIKNEYAREKGYRLLRYDVRLGRSPKTMMEFFEKHIGRGPRGPINPSNVLNSNHGMRRPPSGGKRRRPRNK